MNVICESCSATYDIDASKIPPSGGFFKCRTCGKPVPLTPPPAQPIALASSDDIMDVEEAEPLGEDLEPTPPPASVPAPHERVPAIPLPASGDRMSTHEPWPPPVAPTPQASTKPAPPPAAMWDVPTMEARVPPRPLEVAPPSDSPMAAPLAPSAPVPRFLEDLPAAAPTPRSPPSPPPPPADSMFDDLPAPSPTAATNAPWEAGDGAVPDDLPARLVEGTSDAPTPEISLELTDLPQQESSPSLMDELGLEPETPASFDLGIAPAGPSSAPSMPDDAAPDTAAEPASVTPSRKTRVIIISAAAALLLVVGGGVLAWRLMDGVAPKPAASATAAQGADTTTPSPSEPEPTTTPAPTSPKALPEITQDNVDVLGYEALRTGTQAWIGAAATGAPPHMLWALYRMADAFDDKEAQKLLAARVPKRPGAPGLDETTAAATIGSQLLATQKPAARKGAERLLRSRFPKSARLTYVIARSHNPKRRPELVRALKLLEPVSGEAATPPHDALLLHAKLLFAQKQAAEAQKLLATALAKAPSDVLRVRSALLLAATGHDAPLWSLVSDTSGADIAELAPPARATYLGLLVRRAVAGGDVQRALDLARERVKLAPQDITATVELVRLTHAAGDDVDQLFAQARKQLQDAQAHAQLAAEQVQMALRRSDVAGAKAILDAARAEAPGAVSSWLKLAEGRIAEAQGQLPRARTAYTAAAQGRPKLVEARLALVLAAPGKPAQLLARLTPLAKQAPDSALVSYELARLSALRGDFAAAAEQYGRALWRDPTVADPIVLVLGWAEALARSGQADRAAQVLADVETHHPKDARVWRLEAVLAADRRDFEHAVTAYRRLAQLEPATIDNRIALATVLNDAGNFIDAQGELDQLVKENAANATVPVLLQLGRAWLARDEVKARTYYLDATRMTPTPLGYRLLGELEEKRGKVDEALDAYRKALDLDGGLVDVRLHVATILMQKGEYEQAAAETTALLERVPKNVTATLLLGDALREQGKLREAMAAYQGALKLGGNSPDVLMKLARATLLQQDRLPQAVKLLRQVIKLVPERGEAYYYLGYALKDLGELADARDALQSYVRLEPSGEFAGDVRREIAAMETP